MQPQRPLPAERRRVWTADAVRDLVDPDREGAEEELMDVRRHVLGHVVKHEEFLRLQQNLRLVDEVYRQVGAYARKLNMAGALCRVGGGGRDGLG